VTKAEELYKIWKNYKSNEWKKRLRKVGVVSEEDVNEFLKLAKGRNAWKGYMLGLFVSFVLNKCYKDRFIELDVGAVDGRICVGEGLDWDGVVYVEGNIQGSVGWEMKKGMVVIEGNVNENVGGGMKGGVIVVNGDVGRNVGSWMKGGIIVVNGDVGREVGYSMKGGYILVDGTVEENIGWGMKGGFVIVDRVVESEQLAEYLGTGLVKWNGIWYFSRWSNE